MARISSYNRDELLRSEDQLVISSYEGEGQYGSIYITNNITLDELSNYLNNTFTIGEVNYNLNSMSSSITTNTNALATANVSITTNANSISATATYAVNLASTFGTFDSSGNLTSLSQSFADSILNTSASTDYASASQLTSLTSIVTTNKASQDLIPLIFRQDDAPATSVPLNSLWYDTNDGNKLYILKDISGTNTWTATVDASIAANATNISSNVTSISDNVSSLALRPRVFKQDDEPPTSNMPANSLWYDTNDENKLYIFNGTAWILTDDSRIGVAVTSIATASSEISTNATNISSGATKITELESQFAFTGTDITGIAGALSTSVSSTATSAAGAVASDLDKLEAVFSFDSNGDVDGMTPGGGLATAVNTSANAAISNAALASAASVTTLTSNLNLKPDIFRQDDAPDVTEAVGSIWFDTNDDNKVYVLVSGSPNVWTESTDGRIATNISSLASANTAITTNSTAISSEAAKITELQSQFTYTGNNISGVNGSESLNTAIDTARSDAESASAAKVDTLGAKFFTNYNNATGAGTLTEAFANDIFTTTTNTDFATSSDVTTLTTAVNNKPLTFRQDAEPSAVNPTGSIWFDSNDDNKIYILVAGTPKVWTATFDGRIATNTQSISNAETAITANSTANTANASSITSLSSTVTSNKTAQDAIPQIFRQDDAPAITVPLKSLWYDTNDGNKLYILSPVGDPVVNTWTATVDSTIATAQATANLRPKVFSQDDAPAVTNPLNSIWYDTNDGNKPYLLKDVSGTNTWVASQDGGIAVNASAASTNATAIGNNTTAIGLKPKIFRQNSAPAVTEPVSSVWYDANDDNKPYILVSGTPNVWTLTVDPRTGNTVSGLSDAVADISANTSDISSTASDVTKLEAVFTFDSSDNVSGVTGALNTSINNAASSAVQATANSLDKLEAVFSFDSNNDVDDITGALSTAVTTHASDAITNASLASASDVTELKTQFTFNSSNAITGVTDTLNTVINTAQSDAESASATKVDSLAANFFTGYNNADGTFTAVSVSEAFANDVFTTTTNSDFASASSVTTLSALVGGDANSGLRADIIANTSSISTVEGFAESRYSLKATAGNVVTGMSILATNGTTTDVSSVTFQTDKFIIKSSTTTATPFVLDNNQLKLNVPLNGVTGSFSGELSAGSGNIGGWTINTDKIKSSSDRVELDPDQGLIINDTSGTPKLQVRQGNLSALTSLVSATFSSMNDLQFACWGSNYTTIGNITDSLFKTSSTLYKQASFGTGDRTGTYTGTITTNALNAFASTSANFSGLIYIELRAQISTNTSFTEIIADKFLNSASDSGAGSDLSFAQRAVTFTFNVTGSSDNLYLRFYWKRVGFLSSGYVIFPGSSFDINETNVAFAKTANQTEITDQGIQVASSAQYYFKIDRTDVTGDYVEVKGGLEVDGQSWDFAKTASTSSTSSTTYQKHSQKLPSGTFMKWGYQTGSVEDVTVTFPTAFPTRCNSVSVTCNRNSRSGDGANYAYSVNKNNFVAVTDSPNDFWWIAFGD